MHICVGNLIIIASGNGLVLTRHQAIIWTNAGILLIEPLGTNFNEILSEILVFSFKKIHLNVSSAKWRPFCLGLNVNRGRTSAVQWERCLHNYQFSGSHFANCVWTHNYIIGKFVCSNMFPNAPIRSQFCTKCDISVIVTSANSRTRLGSYSKANCIF